ncbi:tyrosine-type recombinase/integrase [Aliivibrio sp. S4TY2]|uniref:tyrosine-type recombinase/integrase n=1 Tax=unclassified Aliivibrio TaxID=2645654 RepID=UPI00237913D0|nr:MULTISPECIES: tyrosine-type recombinase/integrase [unclassified Aliivibrio]MDD9156734.1 tyrosine-type recombinase/integrase [Aliivibrio sp. S4TY2]MDD9160220.1 tyrosine-type recombinase/integrase [Aliivibrio sp. S4TY1]MDD9164487.1 tyrosine-type recombinase/integrase [Aliivibrio sp. S4MY2]MDD9168643.1 tyrosine-type recombinase/integrase [Aliivibrio sp. S4MY4]MDD9184822.1 tyrosine-type recombinase/integrase [Aliivibrio sp. S4MY3]
MKIKTINNYLDSYFAERRFIVSPSTQRSEASKGNNIRKAIGKRTVDSVLHSDLHDLIFKWHKRFSNKSINGHLTILRAIFKRVMLDGIIERNPMTGLENLKNVKNAPNPFMKSDLTLMYECKNVCEQGKNAVLFDALTGLRISELIAVSWDDVDWQRNVLYVRRARVLNDYKVPKTPGSVRAVDLNPLAVDILKKQLAITGKRRRKTIDVLQRDNKSIQKESIAFIFINSKTRQPYLNAKQFSKAFFTPFLETAGIAHRGVGQLRHTFASQCLTAGISKEWISQQMGHTGTHMIDMHYGKWLREDAPDCALLASQHLQDAFGMPEVKRTVSLPAVPDAASNMLGKLTKKPQLMQLIQAMLEDA